MGHSSRSSDLLHVEASRARVSLFAAMVRGAPGTIAEIASRSS
jgi:hypothetical protein